MKKNIKKIFNKIPARRREEDVIEPNKNVKKHDKIIKNFNTYAIFSDGERHGSSNSSSLSSLFSPSNISSPDTLNEDDVNISGTGKIDGRRLPT